MMGPDNVYKNGNLFQNMQAYKLIKQDRLQKKVGM